MTADTVGGVWTYALQLVRSLRPYGIGVYLATMGKPLSEKQWKEVKKLDNVEVFESTYKLEWMDNPWEEVAQAGEWLLALEHKLQPDLVHLNGYAHGNLAWQAPVVVVGHSCVLSWWEAVKGEQAPGAWSTYRAHITKGLRAAGMVIGVSRAMLSGLQKFYGPLPVTRVIHNGQVIQDFAPAEKQPFVFSMGRIWDEAKNLGLLGTAAAQLEWKVVMAGDCTHPTTNRTLHIPNVQATGMLPAEEIRNYLSQASIYVSPARYEPFGLSVLEAALSGCALVLSGIDSFKEIWQDAALYVRTDDADALARAIGKLIHDPALRNEYSARARKQALSYSSVHMAQAYVNTYTELIPQPITTSQ